MTTEIEERGLQTQQQQGLQAASTPMAMPSGMAAVALMSDDDFARNLTMLKTAQERTRQIQQNLMHEGRDYGVIPGTKKPTLLKAGAEILALAYGFIMRVEVTEVTGNGTTAPLIRYDATTFVHAGAWNGPVVAVGYGTCNSWETKYRYRSSGGGLVCPTCGKPGVIKTKARGNRPEQWWHPSDARPDGGCNENFPKDDPRLTGGTRTPGERVENADPYDLSNTILKIAEKRSVIDGILRATGTSGLFTVDEEEAERKENPDAKSRREFNEWVAEAGLDPTEVLDVGRRLYPDRDIRKLAIWERTAWRSILEREVLYPQAAQPAQAQQPAQAPQQAPQQPQAAATEPPPAGPKNVTPPAAEQETPIPQAQADSERDAIRADLAAGKTTEQISEGIKSRATARETRQPVAAAARPDDHLFDPSELSDRAR